jgi:hypothetical protein
VEEGRQGRVKGVLVGCGRGNEQNATIAVFLMCAVRDV